MRELARAFVGPIYRWGRGGCVKNVLDEDDAVPEMKEDHLSVGISPAPSYSGT